MSRFISLRTLSVWLLLASLVFANAGAGVMNGDFEAGSGDTFDGWETLVDPFVPFDPPTAGFDSNRFAQFSDLDANTLGSQLQQLITIPIGATTLSFDFLFTSSAVSSGSQIPDSFQASLFLPPDFLEGVLPSGDPNLEPAFFSVDDGGLEKSNAAASTSTSGTGLRPNWRRVTLNLSSLGPQLPEDLLLEFVLYAGTDPNVVSTAALDNVVLNVRDASVVPEPSSFAILGMLILLIAASSYTPRIQLFRSPAL